MVDSKFVFCEAQAIGTITHDDAFPINDTFSNALSATNIIDLGDTNTATRDGGDKAEGKPLMIDIYCSVAHAGASSLLYFLLKTCDTEGGTYTTLLVSKFFAVGALIAKKDPVFTFCVPGGLNGAKRFLKLQFGALTADTSAGTFSAVIRPSGE